MKAMHAGLVSGAILNAVRHEKLSIELDWDDILNRLSHFVIDSDVGGNGQLEPVLSILENILCRGLPTLPSLAIEKEMEQLTGLFTCTPAGNTSISAFECSLKRAYTRCLRPPYAPSPRRDSYLLRPALHFPTSEAEKPAMRLKARQKNSGP